MRLPPSHLPHFLRAWRVFRGLTLEQVANILGIKVNSLSDKELGKRPVDTDELKKMAEIYDCEPWMLLAAPPGTAKLDQIKKASALIETLSQKQIEIWLGLGDTLKSPE